MLNQIYISLTAITPGLPWALLTALIFLLVYGTRKFTPVLWDWFDVASPDGRLRHIVQGFPSVALGAFVGSYISGDYTTYYGAVSGAAAPIAHLILKALPGPYQGAVRALASKAGIIAIVLMIGCTPSERATARTIVDAALDAARILCLISHAEQLGTTPDKVAASLCDSEDEVRAWLPHVLGAQKAGAAELGMRGNP